MPRWVDGCGMPRGFARSGGFICANNFFSDGFEQGGYVADGSAVVFADLFGQVIPRDEVGCPLRQYNNHLFIGLNLTHTGCLIQGFHAWPFADTGVRASPSNPG